MNKPVWEMDTSIITVQAQYSFKGSNNDELCFKKGDIITLTQREEGGWWEGTLGDTTGWFPSNYVKEYVGPLPLSETIRPPEEIQAFRSVVFRDLLESEKAHVAELRGLAENFLEPLEGSQILSSNEYTQLISNFVELVEIHEEFLQTLEECNDRVGKVFLSKAPTMKKIHQFYCAAHPRAIVIVDKFREELNVFMEKQGAAKPGLLVLTTGLSKPFRRLDKYAAILQELERHMESGHPDRGDTQRSIAVYKDIASSCSATRRQKELELQILTGPVRGWQGAELSTLGDIIHMGSVAVGPEHKDRYLVLFPQTLLILSVSQRMSAFKYEGKLPITGITVNRLEDTDQIKNAFEISGTLIDRIVAVCQGPSEANRWVELLSPKAGAVDPSSTGAVDLKRNVSSSAVNVPQPPPHSKKQLALDSRGYSTRVSVCEYGYGGGTIYGPEFKVTLPPSTYPSTAPYAELTSYFRRLFRVGKLSRYVVQALLYSQVTKTYDRRHVVMRRRKHKTTVRMQRREKEAIARTEKPANSEVNVQSEGLMPSTDDGTDMPRIDAESKDPRYDSSSTESSSCTSSSCSRGRSNLERQNAVEYVEEDDDAYETITFFAGKIKHTPNNSSEGSTVYEPYGDPPMSVDSGEGELCETNDDGNRSSEMIGSTAIPFLCLNDRESLHSGDARYSAQSNSGRPLEVHTSTAKLLLGDLKQQCSEQSQISSFEHRPAHGRMACENLLNLDESMQIKHSLQQKTITEERHSMPTYFVGNRFNNSSVTEIYIPSWKEDCQVGDAQGPTTSFITGDSEAADRHSVHSSSLDIPAIVPVPDPVAVELLYNFPPTVPPPKDGGETDRPGSSIKVFGCLSREQSPFRKHSINSDKKLVLNPTHHRKDKDDSQHSRNESEARIGKCAEVPSTSAARRCLSYQYVQLSSKGHASIEPTMDDPNNNMPGVCGKAYDPHIRLRKKETENATGQNHPSGASCSEHKCRFCSFHSQGHSPHSSDSGMAGSCTISSPEGPAKFSGDFLLCDYAEQRSLGEDTYQNALKEDVNEIPQNHRVHDDVHVFDDVPMAEMGSNRNQRRSYSCSLRQSRSSHNLGRFALVHESEFDFTDSGQYDHHNDQHPHDTSQSLFESKINGHSTTHEHSGQARITRSRSEERVPSPPLDRNVNVSEPRHYVGRSRIVVNLYDRSSVAMQQGSTDKFIPSFGNEAAERTTFKTGLYAHWWKKEKLPIFVVTSNESLKLPPASGPLSRPISPRLASPIGDISAIRKSHCSKATPSRADAFTSAGDGLLHRFNISTSGGVARGSGKTNWNITNLRSAPPLRPAFLSSVAIGNAAGAGAGGSGGGRSATASITGSISGAAVSCVGSGSSGAGSTSLNASESVHHSLSFNSNSKLSPTYEEDALVLRVIEAYCAAYQSTSRNTMHSGVECDEMTPTLRQLFISVRQLQQEMAQVKLQIAEERSQRGHLQQVLMGHMESYGAANTTC
uniref:DH domain-containing protein n=1 Tax=Anopheles farauti TaxID=69004 RepID=A0A182QMA8_9DIPT